MGVEVEEQNDLRHAKLIKFIVHLVVGLMFGCLVGWLAGDLFKTFF